MENPPPPPKVVTGALNFRERILFLAIFGRFLHVEMLPLAKLSRIFHADEIYYIPNVELAVRK